MTQQDIEKEAERLFYLDYPKDLEFNIQNHVTWERASFFIRSCYREKAKEYVKENV